MGTDAPQPPPRMNIDKRTEVVGTGGGNRAVSSGIYAYGYRLMLNPSNPIFFIVIYTILKLLE
jgi:hypothetical protein